MNLHQVMQISTWLKTYLSPTLHNKDFLVLLPNHSASGVYNSKRFQREIMKRSFVSDQNRVLSHVWVYFVSLLPRFLMIITCMVLVLLSKVSTWHVIQEKRNINRNLCTCMYTITHHQSQKNKKKNLFSLFVHKPNNLRPQKQKTSSLQTPTWKISSTQIIYHIHSISIHHSSFILCCQVSITITFVH